MKVAVLYEASGTVRDAFAARGHDAVSVDLRPCYGAPGAHAVADVFDWLTGEGARSGLDLVVAHPPCTYLAGSGLHWNNRVPGRAACTLHALDHVRRLFIHLDLLARRYAVENPAGRIGSRIGPATQYVQPYDFGHDASKNTGLWLSGLPPLRPTLRVPGRLVPRYRAMGASDRARGNVGPEYLERWSNQTDSGQNVLAPSPERWSLRSTTYPGIAAAMADQWG